jgi:hypothetical protein
MINTERGEVALQVGEQSYRLCLTLGALAQLEQRQPGDLGAVELVRLLRLLLQGGGHEVSEAEIAAWPLTPQQAGEAVTRCLKASLQ